MCIVLQGNSLDIEVGNDSVRDSDLATAPLNIHPSVKASWKNILGNLY